MSETLEKSSENTQKLQKIETELKTLWEKKTLLEKQRDWENKNDVENLEAQISEIEEKITKLLAEKQKIIWETQSSLGKARPLDQKQTQTVMNQLESQTDLTAAEKNIIQENLVSWNYDSLDEVDGFAGILKTLLTVFASLFRPSYMTIESEEAEFMSREKLNPITDKERLEFTQEAKKHALVIEAKYGIPWEVSVAQCILESGWGRSKLAREHGNYFWIKGKWVAMMTKEDYGNGLQDEKAEFKTHKNMEESFEAYGQFLTKNPRYKPAFQYANPEASAKWHFPAEHKGRNPLQFGIALWRAWYATDSKYDQKLTSVMARVEKSDV